LQGQLRKGQPWESETEPPLVVSLFLGVLFSPALLFKLDIRKAFDSVSWEYILDLLQQRGFPPRFRNWVTALFATTTSKMLLNGIAGEPIDHSRGLRQGDPLSPLLFVIAIDPLTQLFKEATRLGLLTKLWGRGGCVANLSICG
jgi:hypothetical protein